MDLVGHEGGIDLAALVVVLQGAAGRVAGEQMHLNATFACLAGPSSSLARTFADSAASSQLWMVT